MQVDQLKSSILCEIDRFEDGTLIGWAHDPAGRGAPARCFILVDGQQVGELVCDGARPDVAASGVGPERVGFIFEMPTVLLDGQQHRVEFRDIRRRHVMLRSADKTGSSFMFAYKWRPKFLSHVDGLRGSGIEGWVVRSRPDAPGWAGECVVRVACEGVTIGFTRANRSRTDVGKALNASASCGFRFVPPENTRWSRVQNFSFYAMPENEELTESPLTLRFMTDEAESRINEITDEINALHVRVTRLRRRMLELAPRKTYLLADYPEWYPAYAAALKTRVLGERRVGAPTPLVSVICPVYRPKIDEFRAAVQSVIAQTYSAWELIVVDDGSRDAALTAEIDHWCATDTRIKSAPLGRNGGISRATNHAIANASGQWIAFFDHDDLLADVALESMVASANATGARVLYSDEDKVDAIGFHSTPAFKPDWNHRLLLGVNYVCHLLVVRRDVLDLVGPLDPKYDGAQDHDLILRIAEKVPHEEILHVPEVLYHWRLTENSTAVDVGAKPYAIDAGITCVREHLVRCGRPAEVTNIKGSTLYRQRWLIEWEPSVEIIIPFKDEVEITSRCLDAIHTKTAYSNYHVTLVDNWSTSEAAARLTDRLRSNPRVRVVRSEEDFNYSRLNNQAAAGLDADFLFLMNNDVLVESPNWLRICVNEALADPSVGIVGGKLFYPNQTVQHAGIISGLGGVAGHIGVGLPEDDYGFGGRLLFAQEYSGVTAAAVLIRTSVFHALNGLDERDLRVAFNDVDFCLRVRQAGHKVIWTPDFVAEHHESLSRGNDERPLQEARFFHEAQTMVERWGDGLLRDPFYNRNFTLDGAPFSELRAPSEAAENWFRAWSRVESRVDPMQPADIRSTGRPKRRQTARKGSRQCEQPASDDRPPPRERPSRTVRKGASK